MYDMGVCVYMYTIGTYEVEMFQRASKKLGLGQAVLKQRGVENEEGKDSKNATPGSENLTLLSKMDTKEIDGLLKYGAYDL